MKILFISGWFPYPPLNGAKIRIYNLIQQLAKHHEITLLSFTKTIPIENANSHVPRLKQICRDVGVVPFRPFVPGSFSAYKGFFTTRPRSLIETYSPEMEKLINKKLKAEKFDVVVASEVTSPTVVSHLATKIKGIPIILDALEVTMAKDAFQNQTSFQHRFRAGLRWFKLKRFTKAVMKTASACTVPSQLEKQNLLEIMPNHPCIEVIPHCLDPNLFNNSFGVPQPRTLVFTGSFTYNANLDAAYYFLKDIYPQVRASLPNIHLKVVGSTNGVALNEWPVNEGVTFTGLLQDVRPVVARSWLSVVPLRMGSGTRLKIIESMALGTPVVSTSKGAEGLNVTHGENIMIADEPKEFSRAIVEIIENPGLREKLSKEGQSLVMEKYSSDVMGKKFASLLDCIKQ